MKDSFQEVKECTARAKMQASKSGMSSLSSWINRLEPGNFLFSLFSCGLSCNVTHEAKY